MHNLIHVILYPNISFSFEQQKWEVVISRLRSITTTRQICDTVYRKPAFSSMYTHFDNFLLTVYKFGMIYTVAYRRFKISSDWTKRHEELNFFKRVFLNNGYPLSFVEDITIPSRYP